jgi:hypothetical protein
MMNLFHDQCSMVNTEWVLGNVEAERAALRSLTID